MLEETLVVWMGEFGRTPKINARNGRDHWPRNFCVAMAGGGIQGGRVVGATDAHGLEIRERPVPVEDYAATIYPSWGSARRSRRSTRSAGRSGSRTPALPSANCSDLNRETI
jgi:hypothetical protein